MITKIRSVRFRMGRIIDKYAEIQIFFVILGNKSEKTKGFSQNQAGIYGDFRCQAKG